MTLMANVTVKWETEANVSGGVVGDGASGRISPVSERQLCLKSGPAEVTCKNSN